MASNYDKMKIAARERFLSYDQAALSERFSLPMDADFLYLDFMGRAYRIHRQTGEVTYQSDPAETGYNEVMTIYDLLCYPRTTPQAAGQFVNMKSLTGIQPAGIGLSQNAHQEEARLFDKQEPALRQALERIGGIPCPGGDIAYEIPVFRDLRMRLAFWHSDDEFDAAIQLFWDANVLSYMHYETVWFANIHLLSLLRRLME